jgi:DNA-binding PadR family transcriptional regulator
MAKRENLGEFEQLILAALMMLGDNAYGITIHLQTEKLAAGIRAVSLGSVYSTLDRLEQKGYVKSWFGGPRKNAAAGPSASSRLRDLGN